ncbi:MAG: hypothetical protein KC609_23015 [Myxococcales bacterium]|nr:hypothetical protein [Myxococcales bacterium]
MIWKRIRTWWGPDQDEQRRAEEIDRLLSQLGHPPRHSADLDEHSQSLLVSELPDSLKRLAARGWLVRFDTEKSFHLDGTHARLVKLLLRRIKLEPPAVKEHWQRGVLVGLMLRRSGDVCQALYTDPPAPNDKVRADLPLLMAALRAFAQLRQSSFEFVHFAESGPQAMIGIIPRPAMRIVRERLFAHREGELPDNQPVFVCYSEDLLATSALRTHVGPLYCGSSDDLARAEDLGCVVGRLAIEDATLSQSALQPLRNLSALGSLSIRRTKGLLHLDGLDHLSQIGGPIWIEANRDLETFDGLSGLRRLQGSLRIRGNGKLRCLRGLHNLQTIAGHLDIVGPSAVGTLRGLEALRHLEGDLRIAANASLSSIDALKQLQYLGGDLLIEGNPKLAPRDVERLVERLRSHGFVGNTIYSVSPPSDRTR